LAVERSCSAATSSVFSRSACSFAISSCSEPMRWFISRRWACCWSEDWRIACTASFWKEASGLDSSALENCL
jgi:hypothetical protein